MIGRWWNQVRDWWQRDRLAAELDEELRFHQAQMPNRLGNLTRIREEAREVWSVRWLEETFNDFRHATRSLRRTPAFALVSAATLGLAIGANTAVFSLANWLVLRPVPGVRAPGEVVTAHFEGARGLSNSHLNVRDLGARTSTFEGIAAQSASGNFVPVAIPGQPPEFMNMGLVTANYFEVLGAPMALGRGFTDEETLSAATSLTVVISDRLWRSRFNADSTTLGRSIVISAIPARIVGVTPRGFLGTSLTDRTDVWLPGPSITAVSSFRTPEIKVAENRGYWIYLELVGRLRDGVTTDRASADLVEVQRALVREFPEENKNWVAESLDLAQGLGVPPATREEVDRILVLLSGVTAIVLLIGCANVANFFLFRGVARRDEVAIRQALGGSRSRLFRSQLAECLLVAIVGGALAIPTAVGLTRLFIGFTLPGTGALTQVGMDWRVWAFAAAASLLTGVLSGVAPALASAARTVSPRLRAAGGRVAGTGNRVRALLATSQVALALPLVVLTVLLVGTLRNLRHVDVGFDADQVTMFTIGPAMADYNVDQSVSLAREAVTKLKSIQGVEAVSLTAGVPFTYNIRSLLVSDQLAPGDTGAPANAVYIVGDYFGTMGIELLAGRAFHEGEDLAVYDGIKPAIVSERLARRLFPRGNPVGQLVRRGTIRIDTYEVIGVVSDSRWASLADEGLAPFYQPLPPSLLRTAVTIAVRSGSASRELQPAIRSTMAAVAPNLALFELMRLSDRIELFLGQQRLLARMLTLLGGVAVALAGIGLYAVIAFWTAERQKEIGIRMALGARSESILVMVLAQAGRVAAAGFVIGIAGAGVAAKVVSSRLFGISAGDPAVLALGAGVLAMVVLAGALVPALAASRVDSMVALRTD